VREGTGDDLRDLVAQLSRDARLLVRLEAELAEADVREKSSTAASAARLFGGTALLGLIAAGSLTACAILAIALFIPSWAAAAVVATAACLAGLLLALRGRRRVRSTLPLLPERAIASVKEDIEWVVQQTRSAPTSQACDHE